MNGQLFISFCGAGDCLQKDSTFFIISVLSFNSLQICLSLTMCILFPTCLFSALKVILQ